MTVAIRDEDVARTAGVGRQVERSSRELELVDSRDGPGQQRAPVARDHE